MPITPTITVGFKANHLLQGRFNQAHVSHLWKQLIRPKRKKRKKVTGCFNRPISNFAFIAKIVEKVVFNQLSSVFNWGRIRWKRIHALIPHWNQHLKKPDHSSLKRADVLGTSTAAIFSLAWGLVDIAARNTQMIGSLIWSNIATVSVVVLGWVWNWNNVWALWTLSCALMGA